MHECQWEISGTWGKVSSFLLTKTFLTEGWRSDQKQGIKPIFWQVLALWGEIILRLTGVSNVNVRVPGKTGRFSFQLLH